MITKTPYTITIYDKEGTLIAANYKCDEYWLISLEKCIGSVNIVNNELFTKDSQIETIMRVFNGERGEVVAEIPLTHTGASKNHRINIIHYLILKGNSITWFVSRRISPNIKRQR